MGKMQFRKSKKIGPVRLTASKSGVGISAGTGPVRVSRGADGKTRRTVSAPGTGLRKTDVIGGSGGHPTARRPSNELRPDIQAAQSRAVSNFGGGRDYKDIEAHLLADEMVELTCPSVCARKQGLLVLTDRRLLFLSRGMVTEDFPFDEVSSIQLKAGMLTGAITIAAGGNEVKVKNCNNDDAAAIVDRAQGHLA